MDREDIKKVIGVMMSSYPNYKPQDMKMTVDIWHEMLQNYEASDVFIGLKTYIATDTSGFAPSIGQIIGMIHKPQELSQMSEREAWSLVRKALSNGTYNSKAEFEKLPPLIQKAVGDSNQLYVWATDEDYNEGVISSQFISAYKTVCKRAEEERKMPLEAKARLDMLREQALGMVQKGVIGIDQISTSEE